jgi:ubiquinone/menaquinone biosynthesis C-methylase UbiE
MVMPGELRAFADRHPKLKGILKSVVGPFRPSTSSAYVALAAGEERVAADELTGAWKTEAIPALQRKDADQSLAAYRGGQPARNFDVLIDLLRPLTSPDAPATLLEVGCSSGYYAEAFEIKSLPVLYSGCDFSPAFVALARRCYPALDFRVADATALNYPDASFDIVVSGCCLLHIRDYDRAIADAARVARHHVVFHRTPVVHLAPTRFFTKLAYGVKTLEIHFNEDELVKCMHRHGLRVVAIVTLNASWHNGDANATKTYLCEKASQ